MDNFDLKKYLAENRLNGELSPQLLNGQLHYESFGDNEIWYVTFPKLGNIIVSSKLVDELGPLLNDLEYKDSMWEVSIWDHTQSNSYSRYKVTKYIK